MKISVIVPVYNTEQYLPACIESILGQSFGNFELFLVDDGSTDNSLQVCQRYAQKDSRIIVLSKENGGQGTARNMALEQISGDCISFIDSDDYIKPNMFYEMIEQMCEHNADIVLCCFSLAYENGHIIERNLPQPIVLDNAELMRQYVSSANIATCPFNKLYKKELFEKLRFPEIRANEDAYILHEILGKCQIAVHTGKSLYVQNIRSDSTEHKPFTKNNLVLLECSRRLMEYYAANYPELYELVAYKEVNDIAALMERILTTGSYLKNRKTYHMLEKCLHEEYQSVRKCFPKGDGLTLMAIKAISNPWKFKLLNGLRGFKYKFLHG